MLVNRPDSRIVIFTLYQVFLLICQALDKLSSLFEVGKELIFMLSDSLLERLFVLLF